MYRLTEEDTVDEDWVKLAEFTVAVLLPLVSRPPAHATSAACPELFAADWDTARADQPAGKSAATRTTWRNNASDVAASAVVDARAGGVVVAWELVWVLAGVLAASMRAWVLDGEGVVVLPDPLHPVSAQTAEIAAMTVVHAWRRVTAKA